MNLKRTISIAAITVSSLFASTISNADFRGVSVDVLDSGLGIGSTYRYYVNVDPGDQILGVFGNEWQLRFNSAGAYQNPFGTHRPPNEELINLFPSLEFDSFVTIGLLTDTDDAMLDIAIDWTQFENGGDIETNNGGWFVTPDDAQSYEVDGRVLIGQFTGGEWGGFPYFIIQGRNADSTSWTRHYERPLSCLDHDEDGACWHDNCNIYNPDQADCNINGIGDVCDLANGTSGDSNGDGIPDECQSLADIDDDGQVTVLDLLVVIWEWGQVGDSGMPGDVTWDGVVNNNDLLEVLSAWGIIYPLDLTGGCCIDQTCDILSLAECLVTGGYHLGDYTNCAKDACVLDAPDCDADLHGDGYIEFNDYALLILNWGECQEPKCYADLNGDGIVNINDVMYLLSLNWHVLCK